MKTLFEKTYLNGVELKNRLIRSATWENLADEKGHMTEPMLTVYEELAKGGVGLIITGYAFVMKEEQPNPGMMGIYDDCFIDEYCRLTDKVHQYGSKIVLQIVYGGSQTTFQPQIRKIWGPSAVKHPRTGVTPKEMTEEAIGKLITAFADAAERAKKAGFDGVELHGAHGYLLSQMLSPYFNRRADKYGGSIENRARMILEVYEAARSRVGKDFNILIKLNCSDFMEQGASFNDCKYVSKELAKRGINAIEISVGNVKGMPEQRYAESILRDYAAEIAELVDVPVILVNKNKTLQTMEEILNQTKIEYFSMSRALLRQPDLVNRWINDPEEKAACIHCSRCFSNKNRCVFEETKE